MNATEQLDRDIREIVLAGDADTIVRMLAVMRNLNTALECENQTHRAFVAAWDESQKPFAVVGYERFRAIQEGRQNALEHARQRLATDHNLPLPGEGVNENPIRVAGPCPTCKGDLTERFDHDGESWCECASCGGIWYPLPGDRRTGADAEVGG